MHKSEWILNKDFLRSYLVSKVTLVCIDNASIHIGLALILVTIQRNFTIVHNISIREQRTCPSTCLYIWVCSIFTLQESIDFPEDFFEYENKTQVSFSSQLFFFFFFLLFFNVFILLLLNFNLRPMSHPWSCLDIETADLLAAEPWPSLAAHSGGAFEERTSPSSSNGGIGATRGAAAHHG